MKNTLQTQGYTSVKKNQGHTTRSFENIAGKVQKSEKMHLTMIQTHFWDGHKSEVLDFFFSKVLT